MDAYIGEVRLFPWTFATQYWLPCLGQIYPIQQYQALAAVIGNIYGGDPSAHTFQLPNLQGCVAVGYGDDPSDGFDPAIGAHGGVNAVTLGTATVPAHTHTMNMVQLGLKKLVAPAANNFLAVPGTQHGTSSPTNYNFYTPPDSSKDISLASNTLNVVGNGTIAGHENRQPFLTFCYFICYDGAFPVRQ